VVPPTFALGFDFAHADGHLGGSKRRNSDGMYAGLSGEGHLC
jgi:hypothetical protein